MSLFWISGVIQKVYAIGESLSKQFLLTLMYASEPEQLTRKNVKIHSSNMVSCGVVGSPHNVQWLVFNFFINVKLFLQCEGFPKVACSGKCCKLSNSFTTDVLLGFIADLGHCQEKTENVKSAAPDVINFNNLSRFKGLLICGCWLEWTNKF